MSRGEDGERDERRGDADSHEMLWAETSYAETFQPDNGIRAKQELFDDSGADDDEKDKPDGHFVEEGRRCTVVVAAIFGDERWGDGAGDGHDDAPCELFPGWRGPNADGSERQPFAATDDP